MITHRRQRFSLFPLLPLSLGVFLGILTGCDKPEARSPEASVQKAVAVRVAPVELQTLQETVRGIGTLRAAETVEIKPEVDGFVREIHFVEGCSLDKDELLISIDDRKLKHQLEATKATLQVARVRLADAQRRLKRIQGLIARNVADQDEVDQSETECLAAQAEVERMRAEVELAQARLDDTRLRAPFAGVISERHIDVGDYVQAGDHLATLYRISQMEIAFALPERFMERVRPGQPVAVTVTAFPKREFSGQVYFVSPRIDETTRDFLVKATIDNPEGVLKPGAFGTAVVTIGVREQVPVVPEKALVATRTGYIVFTVNNHTAQRREVTIGLRQTGSVEIRAGVHAGEQVVIEGQLTVSDGAVVHLPEGERERSEPTTQTPAPESEGRP